MKPVKMWAVVISGEVIEVRKKWLPGAGPIKVIPVLVSPIGKRKKRR